MSDVFDRLKADGRTVIRNNAICRAYDTGKRRMLKAGASPEVASEYARTQLRLAATAYDALP